MAHPQKRIIGSEAMNAHRPALQVRFMARRRPVVPVWAWIVGAAVAVILGAWIDAVIEVPVFGAIFAFIAWRVWRSA